MAKRVFFSFHYQDVIDFRANVVRNHWVTKESRDIAGFFDASLWESAKKDSPLSVKRLINSGLERTSTTCVLIGTNTWARPWVRYEIVASFRRENRMLGVHINSIAGKDQRTKALGVNPFEYLGVRFFNSGLTATLYEVVGSKWIEYTEYGPSATYQTGGVGCEHCGKFYKFSDLYNIFDWGRGDGYNNFASWVENA
ncbi:MAG: hypothetical protein CVU59_00220 [Deltaproteobacteria bacterium HGW-Deltaproteobacteria-17]|nr:MAG: hypothetical protein CVU59_00220 [Deltaproteobacteria bacterium HGW-Deltaproteobacteria-17]